MSLQLHITLRLVGNDLEFSQNMDWIKAADVDEVAAEMKQRGGDDGKDVQDEAKARSNRIQNVGGEGPSSGHVVHSQDIRTVTLPTVQA